MYTLLPMPISMAYMPVLCFRDLFLPPAFISQSPNQIESSAKQILLSTTMLFAFEETFEEYNW